MNFASNQVLCLVLLSLYTTNASAMLSRSFRFLFSAAKQSGRVVAPRASTKLKSAVLKKSTLYSSGLVLLSGSAGLALNKSQDGVSQKTELDLDLISSCQSGDVGHVLGFLNSGADVNTRGQFGRTALMEAIMYDNTEIVEILLGRGADVNIMDDHGFTPLIIAAKFGDGEVVDLLIKNGADISAANNRGWTAADWAEKNGYIQLSLSLANRGVRADAVKKEKKTNSDVRVMLQEFRARQMSCLQCAKSV